MFRDVPFPQAERAETLREMQEPGLEEAKMTKYTVIVAKDTESRTYMAFVPALRGCRTWGRTKRAAFRNALEAIEVYLEGLRKMGKRPPADIEQRVAVLG